MEVLLHKAVAVLMVFGPVASCLVIDGTWYPDLHQP